MPKFSCASHLCAAPTHFPMARQTHGLRSTGHELGRVETRAAGSHSRRLQQAARTRARLNGMAKGVPQVQGGAHAALLLICCHNFSLVHARPLNGVGEGLGGGTEVGRSLSGA